MTIAAMKRNLEALSVDDIAVSSIDTTKEFMADLNAEQMNKGVRRDGSIMPDYSLRSVLVYGKPAGPIKLYDTGAFYKGIKVDVSGVKISTYSTDSKSTMLEDRYGSEIFGLSIPFKREYIQNALQPEFFKQIKQALKL